MSGREHWRRDGADWPNREASRFVRTTGLTWHVQVMGAGPTLLLLHGTGAATHSWRGLMPLLARHFTVVAPDLPGHGFTDSVPAHRLSLPGMARAVQSLLWALDRTPALAVGHSAGAAILARMCLDGAAAPRGLVSLNGAFLPFGGAAGQVFSPLARFLVGVPLLWHSKYYPTAILFVVYGALVLYGFFVWLKASREERDPAPELSEVSA